MILAEDCWHKSLKPLMESVREQMGDIPVYLTFDIDGIDPTACPGTGIIMYKCYTRHLCIYWVMKTDVVQ